MKRITVFTLLFFLCISVFSEGYRGTYWGETMPELANKGLLFEMIQDNNYTYMREQARVLGQSANIWYCLSKQKLVGICYTIEDIPESRSQIDKLLDTRKLKLLIRNKIGMTEEQTKQFRELTEEQSANKTPYAAYFVDDIIAYNSGRGSLIEDLFLKKIVEESTVEYIKADYNYDTEVHIFEGVLYGYIIVAYTETPQDF